MINNANYALCTLFNTMYLDKGLVLYDSLEKVSNDFTLFVLAMDDKCFEILEDMKRKHLVPIRLCEFENEKLLKVKHNRTIGEYCWTCSSSLIKYVLETFSPEYCSYIDADMFFYGDPHVIIDEMKERQASVSIVGHRFCFYDKESWKIVGKYCVECNTFRNDSNARDLLNIWINQCIEHCSADGDGVYWGDQKYMDNWINDYNYVMEINNLGAGVAPWNLPQYKLMKGNSDKILLKCKKEIGELLFYHFEDISYLSKKQVKIGVYSRWGIDDKLVKFLYIDYLKALDSYKDLLKAKYNLDVIIFKHPASPSPSPLHKKKNICKIIKGIFYYKLLFLLFKYIPSRLFEKKDILFLD